MWGMGMLRVVYNYYSKSTFIVILIKPEKLVFVLVNLYILEYLRFFTGYTGTLHSKNSRVRFDPEKGPMGADPFLGQTDLESG